jgi:hypothetical protein
MMVTISCMMVTISVHGALSPFSQPTSSHLLSLNSSST